MVGERARRLAIQIRRPGFWRWSLGRPWGGRLRGRKAAEGAGGFDGRPSPGAPGLMWAVKRSGDVEQMQASLPPSWSRRRVGYWKHAVD